MSESGWLQLSDFVTTAPSAADPPLLPGWASLVLCLPLHVHSCPAKFRSFGKMPSLAATHPAPPPPLPGDFLVPSHAIDMAFREEVPWERALASLAVRGCSSHWRLRCIRPLQAQPPLSCSDCAVATGPTRWRQALVMQELSQVLGPQQGQWIL